MSTKAGTLEAPRSPAFGPKEWTAMLVIAALSVTALVMSVVALERGTTTTTIVAPGHAAAGNAIERIYERSQPVTGTGPGLVAVADASILQGIYERSQPVTGTGPDLAAVGSQAFTERIYRNSGPVTGTGPDLQHLGGN